VFTIRVPWIGVVLESPYSHPLEPYTPSCSVPGSLTLVSHCRVPLSTITTKISIHQHGRLDSLHIMAEGQITRSAPKASQTAVLRPAKPSLAFSSPLFVSSSRTLSRPKIMGEKKKKKTYRYSIYLQNSLSRATPALANSTAL
jgi:hypothetical protein